jgi:4-hydroxybenzoate polyprenyltransferase
LIFGIIATILAISYSVAVIKYKYIGNLFVPTLLSLALIVGAVATYSSTVSLLPIVGLIFLISYARELYSDVGDLVSDSPFLISLPVLIGVPGSLAVAGIVTLLAGAFVPFLFFFQILSWHYLYFAVPAMLMLLFLGYMDVTTNYVMKSSSRIRILQGVQFLLLLGSLVGLVK